VADEPKNEEIAYDPNSLASAERLRGSLIYLIRAVVRLLDAFTEKIKTSPPI